MSSPVNSPRRPHFAFLIYRHPRAIGNRIPLFGKRSIIITDTVNSLFSQGTREYNRRPARIRFLTGRRSAVIDDKEEAEGPDRRANRLDTEIRSPEVEGEADYTWRSGGRGPGANAQSISRTRLGAITSAGGLRTVAATDRTTDRPLPFRHKFLQCARGSCRKHTVAGKLQTQGPRPRATRHACRAPERGSLARL